MPQLVVAGIVEALALTAVEEAILSLVVNLAFSQLASAFIQSAFGSNKRANTGESTSSQNAGLQQVVRSAVANRMVIYGQAKISGPLVYASVTGARNERLHLVIALTGHEVQEIGDIYFNDDLIPSAMIDARGNILSGRYAGAAAILKHTGAPGQQADPFLMADDGNWTALHRGDGISYLVVILLWNPQIFLQGIPNISAVVKGKKLYDPRDNSTRYSTNWALAVRDYLSNPDYGLGSADSEIDDASVIAAANISDERVAGPAYSNTFTVNPVNTPTTAPNVGGYVDPENPLVGQMANGDYTYAVLFRNNFGTSPVGPAGTGTTTTTAMALSQIPVSSNSSVTARDIYRSKVGTVSPLFFVATINDNVTTQYFDTLADSALGGAPPGINTAYVTNLNFASIESTIASGDGVTVSTTGTLPAPLAAATVYYAITADPNNVLLASSYANSLAGTAIQLTSAGTGVHTISYHDGIRYTCNGILDTGTKPLDNTKQLITAGGGKIVYTQGKWQIFAGAYIAPSGTLTASDLAGDMDIIPTVERKDLFNGVRGTFVAPINQWQATDFPQVDSATYQAQDGGQQIIRDVDFPFTQNVIMAQRLAKLMLEKSRQSVNVNFPAKYTAFSRAVCDNLQVTIAELGWANKEFTVEDWQFKKSEGVVLVLQEESPAAYAWGAGDAQSVYADPPTNLPNPNLVGVPGSPAITESLFQTTGSAGVKARATVKWAASADAFVTSYEPQYKAHGDLKYLSLPLQAGLQVNIDDIAPGTYDFRVRAFNSFNVSSQFSQVVTKEILGLTAPPADVSGFSVIAIMGQAQASWNLAPDLDVQINGSIVIRWSPLTSGATWINSVIYDVFPGGAVQGTLPLKSGTYLAKAQDSSDNFSVNAVSFVVTQGQVTGFTVVGTITEDPAFAGAKTNVAATGGGIQLDSTTLIDSMATPIDSWPFIDSLGGVSATGSYAFHAFFDLATVAVRRYEVAITAAQFDTGDLIDARLTLLDDWGLFDGALVEDCDVTISAATTNTDPAGSPTWSAWTPFFVADFNCRAIKLKADFVSGNSTHNILVSALSVTASTSP